MHCHRICEPLMLSGTIQYSFLKLFIPYVYVHCYCLIFALCMFYCNVWCMVHQGLLVQADAVSTPYSYESCNLFYVLRGATICLNRATAEVESAPVIPPFAYNNQCSSVLLTSYFHCLFHS